MEDSLINLIERVGSLGLLGWLLVWATGTAWPKVSSHLDVVSAKLDRIGDQLTGLREDITEIRNVAVGAAHARPASAADTSNTGRACAAPTGRIRYSAGSKA